MRICLPPFRTLVQVRDSSLVANEFLTRIHYGDLPTVYPAVSQLVFAAAVASTPIEATFHEYVVVMKCYILAFDVATLLLVAATLRFVGAEPGWLVAYGWCPLVMKEYANSGHLDSIAVCFTCLAVYLLVRSLFGERSSDGRYWMYLIGAGLSLSLAFGAKLYPLVLLPLAFATAWRRGGLTSAMVVVSFFLLTAALILTPVLTGDTQDRFVWNSAPEPAGVYFCCEC